MTKGISPLGRLLGMPSAAAGLAILVAVVVGALLAGWISHAPFDRVDLDSALKPPSLEHPFGTDPFGRDVFSRVLHGARVSLGVGFMARTISLVLGLLLGSIAGYFGRRLDSVVMRLADVTFAFPTLLLLIAIVAVVTPGIVSLFVTLGVVGWASVARLVRAQVISIKEREYVQAAKAAGAGHFSLLFRHVLPACIGPVIIVYTMGLGTTIMAEASLSFLGLGIQPPRPSLGGMIAGGIVFLRTAPWLTMMPGLVLTSIVCALNLLGDGLRDALSLEAPRREKGN